MKVKGKDGKLITESLIDYTRKNIRNQFGNLDDFLRSWSKAEKKQAIIEELKDDGVLLEAVREEMGQTELDDTLSDKLADVREIVQRCERREMLPLDDDLPAYLKHKFDRIAVDVREVLADEAYDAIRARLIRIPRGGSVKDARSLCFPLVVNNLVTRAMNAATTVAYPRVTADVIGGC